jgi:hypothetical protein
MRFGKEIKDREKVVNHTFAYVPMRVNGQWVWLEHIYEMGHYRYLDGRFIWISRGFWVGKEF